MAKPTAKQLEKINTFSRTPLQADDVEVYDNLMIDTRPIMDRGLKIAPALLRVFQKDIERGVPQLMVHNTSLLPVGKVFESRLVNEDVGGEATLTLYGTHYLPRGLKVTGASFDGMTTDDLITMVDTGVLTDTSIGFSSGKYECSICHNDIRDWRRCEHYPLQQYAVDGKVETCFAIAQEQGGALRENSYVYAGACDRASILSADGSIDETRQAENSHLYPVTDLKRVPLDAEVTMRFSAGSGVSILSNKPLESGNLAQEDQSMTFEELKKDHDELVEKHAQVEGELAKKTEELAAVGTELSTTQESLKAAEEKAAQLETELNGLKDQVTALSADKDTAEKYVTSLKTKAIELSVKLRGNNLSADRYAKYLDSLAVAELEEEVASLQSSVQETFGGAQLSTGAEGEGEDGEMRRTEHELAYSDMSEEEQSEYLAEAAHKLMEADKTLSYKDAAKLALKQIIEKEGK